MLRKRGTAVDGCTGGADAGIDPVPVLVPSPDAAIGIAPGLSFSVVVLESLKSCWGGG